ncbi:hypothetical protein U1P98_10150 [Lysinibacillus irui]|uniref:Uncharacterized protein n=1 Tax=Lysinibacillus irui TaxID=2998077 RepID=A0AAJ5RPX4_9BACI|nr:MULTISPECIES: hypothetical protein [Lysinibacillus]MEA0554939.1 hypothetical protein [Lysinibacillus irui]MEA0976654.1 hypothetical protein [Lysinibacillus irui]MEA1042808.1 hypothetical protein [Lysinibacillus irui]WDV05569.1 hypothetical protein OU989_14830 [Lysinibacillus irui]
MVRRFGLVIGLLVVIIAILILFDKLVVDDKSVANKGEQPPITNEELSLSRLKEKLLEKYVGIDVKTTEEKELVIQVVGTEDYLQTVKKDMESIAKNAIKSSPLKNYPIVFERWEFTSLRDDNKKIGDDINLLMEELIAGLEDFDVYEYLVIENRTTITIQTTIKGASHEGIQLAIGIEEAIKKIVQANASQNNSYVINILNAQRQKIN